MDKVTVAKYLPGYREVERNNAVNRLTFCQRWLEVNDMERKLNDNLFNNVIPKENIETLVAVIKNATETEVNESRRLLTDDYIYSLEITSQRVHHSSAHLSRILLPHSIENTDADVCLFVRDIKRGRKLVFEPTIKFYEQLLRSKKITRPIIIIPVNQLYNEFASFELRRKLTYLYDKFLVDKAVAAHVNRFLGDEITLKGRCVIPIDIQSDNLADEIESNLRKVFYRQINNGIVHMVQVGRHSMSDQQIAENITELLKQLGTLHPGGSNNICKLHLKPNVNISVTVAVPIYINIKEILSPATVIKTEGSGATGFVEGRVQKKQPSASVANSGTANKTIARSKYSIPNWCALLEQTTDSTLLRLVGWLVAWYKDILGETITSLFEPFLQAAEDQWLRLRFGHTMLDR